ncbi:MAG: serine/threonine-protein kinase [Gemmatimonadales bacterium]
MTGPPTPPPPQPDAAAWDRIQAVFHRVADLPLDAQLEALSAELGDEPGLLGEVMALLAADRRRDTRTAPSTRDWLAGAVGDAARDLLDARPDLVPGTLVGPWRVIREIGRGGMGSVHLAARDDAEYDAQVAIKVIRGGPIGGLAVARFRVERQILAGLDHPNVARMLDGGTTAAGLPWLALEYVEGEPIDRFCDARRLSVRERIALFLLVAEAVEYAHRRLVVHRDLKPGNVLVTADGVPKLLDFGIAKLLDPEAVDSGGPGPSTTAPLRLMTPAYASPEQVRGQRVSTATDVYALGLLLYELLAGQQAQQVTGSTPAEMEREICQREPSRPSARVDAAIAAARDTTAARLARLLVGDLDNIVLTALRKEPDRRYASVAAMAEDLRRYLDGRPVLARGTPWGYRAGKFVRRHRAAVAAGGLGVASLAAAVMFYTGRLSDERDLARAEATRANAIADFLQDVFSEANPDRVLGREVSVADLFERGAARIDSLEVAPETKAGLLLVMGNAFRGVGDLERAEALLREAVEQHRVGFEARGWVPGEVGYTDALDALGNVLWERGRYDEAEAAHRESLAILHAAVPGSEQEATALHNLGVTLKEAGRFDEAAPLLEEARAVFHEVAPDSRAEAVALSTLAALRTTRSEDSAATRLLREAVAIYRTLPEADREGEETILTSLGQSLVLEGRLDEAEAVIAEALGIAERRYGTNSIEAAGALEELGRLELAQGDSVSAERELRRAILAYSAVKGERHPDVAYTTSDLAELIAARGRFAEADSLHRRAVSVARETLEADNPYLARALHEHAKSLLRAGDTARARPLLVEALRIAESAVGADHPFTRQIAGRLEATRR